MSKRQLANMLFRRMCDMRVRMTVRSTRLKKRGLIKDENGGCARVVYDILYTTYRTWVCLRVGATYK